MTNTKDNEKKDNNISATKTNTTISNDDSKIEIEKVLAIYEKDPEIKKLIDKFDEKIPEMSLKDLLLEDQKRTIELLEAQKQKEEYLSLLQRFKADFENYKKRSEKNHEMNIKLSSERIITKIFEPVEDLNRALSFAKENNNNTIPFEGIDIIHDKFSRILEDEGVVFIEPKKGDAFDPRYHEAFVADNSGKHEPNIVLQLFEKGYMIKDRVIHAAKVMVSTEKAVSEESLEE